MGSDDLDLGSLSRAVTQLERAYSKAPVIDLERDGAVQRFEYTFELSRKMIRRHMELMGERDVDRWTVKDLFREAATAGLIDDPRRWFKYQETRNITSHNYDQNKAEAAFSKGKEFAIDVRKLLDELLDRHA